MDYFLFILVNATLFIRPPEIFPGLQDFQIYLYLIVPCLLVSFPSVLEQLNGKSLETRPVTVCVLGLLVAAVLSNLVHLKLNETAGQGFEFLKIVLYYLLLVGVVNTPARLRQFLFWLAIFSMVVALLAVLHYHGVISVPSLAALEDRRGTDALTGEDIVIRRLRGTGIFGDPNDFSLMLVLALPVCLYGFTDRRLGVAKYFWLAPLGLFTHALFLTQSRGGFLAFLAGVLAFLYARFGWRRCLPLALLLLPALFALFAGRLTSLSVQEGTSQQRIQIWNDSLMFFRESPVFGIGMGQYTEMSLYVAHNSFLHSFVELGFVGGMLFLGAFYLALWLLYRIGKTPAHIFDPEMRRLQPYLVAIVAGSAVGMLTLSRCYIVSTYTVLGLATAYLRIATVYPPPVPVRFDTRLVQRLAVVSVGFLAVSYVFVRLFTRWA